MSLGTSSSRPRHRQRSQPQAGASRAISPALIDSEDEYERFCGPLPALTFENQGLSALFSLSVCVLTIIITIGPPLVPTTTMGTGSRVHKKKRQKNRQLSEKGVGTDASGE